MLESVVHMQGGEHACDRVALFAAAGRRATASAAAKDFAHQAALAVYDPEDQREDRALAGATVAFVRDASGPPTSCKNEKDVLKTCTCLWHFHYKKIHIHFFRFH